MPAPAISGARRRPYATGQAALPPVTLPGEEGLGKRATEPVDVVNRLRNSLALRVDTMSASCLAVNEEAMRVPDEWLSAVFFLGSDVHRKGAVETRYRGTGFYFSMENEVDPSLDRLYLVTAKHNILGARQDSGPLYIRVNTEDGASAKTTLAKKNWVFHKDPTIDVAVLSVDFRGPEDGPRLEYAYVHSELCLSDETATDYIVGIGSDVAVVGLFAQREGVKRNIPIVRAGVIAAMPGEPIDDGTGPPYRAYLAELLSIGGLSGSPVFVLPDAGRQHRHPSERIGDRIRTHTEWNQPAFLLGLVRSHWDEAPLEPYANLPRGEWMNRGIAAVTPISGVLDVLGYRVLRNERRKDAAQATARRSATGD